MSTATIPQTPLPIGRRPAEKPEASQAAIADWEAMVISGQYDPATAAAAGMTRGEYDSRRALLVQRREHYQTLSEHVPTAEAQAAKAEAVVAKIKALLAAPIPDTMTAAELRLTVALVDPHAKTDRVQDLGHALVSLAGDGPRTGLGLLRNRALDLRHKAMDLRTRAERFLIDTCNVGPDTASQKIQEQQSRLRRQIAERVVVTAEQVVEQREMVEDLTAGRREVPGPDPSPGAFRQYLTGCKAKLKELCNLSLSAGEARAANANDEAAIARLQEDLKASLEAHRQKCFEPTAMSFIVD